MNCVTSSIPSPHGDHWTGNAFFDAPVIAHEGVRDRILNTDLEEHIARVSNFGPEEPALLQGYTPNAPVITFKNGMTLHVGDHTFQMTHMPGHTLYQAAVSVKEDGVVFTSDNIFRRLSSPSPAAHQYPVPCSQSYPLGVPFDTEGPIERHYALSIYSPDAIRVGDR